MIDSQVAILLGLIQGFTEFIPVSSTAHLRVVPAFMSLPDPGAAYSAVIQLGTLASLLVYFRKDLIQFTLQTWHAVKDAGSGQSTMTEEERKAARIPWFLVLGTIPVSVFGLLLKDYITGPFRSLEVIAASLIGFAILLWIADRTGKLERKISDMTWADAFWIGMAQSLALIPGASRSGTTLMMGLFLGLSRHASARFSFLLSIPAIGLSGVYELIKDWDQLEKMGMEGLFLGTVVAGLSGYIAVAGLLQFLRSHSTAVFVVYRILLGVLITGLLAFGILS